MNPKDAKKYGGQLLLGGSPLEAYAGYFMQPTVRR